MNYKTPLLCFTCLALLELTAGCVVYGICPVYSAAGMASGLALAFRQCRLSYVFWGTVALLLLTCLLHWGEVKQDVRRLTDSLLHAEDKAREARREKPAPAEEANTAIEKKKQKRAEKACRAAGFFLWDAFPGHVTGKHR